MPEMPGTPASTVLTCSAFVSILTASRVGLVWCWCCCWHLNYFIFVVCLLPWKKTIYPFWDFEISASVHYKACGRSGNSKSGCLQKIMMLCGEIRMWLATWDAFYFFNKPCWIITWSSPGVAATSHTQYSSQYNAAHIYSFIIYNLQNTWQSIWVGIAYPSLTHPPPMLLLSLESWLVQY